MVIHYNPRKSTVGAFLSWKGTLFSLVLTSAEYWVLLAMHAVLVVVWKLINLQTVQSSVFKWEFAVAIQYFLAFILALFYNHCYRRYMSEIYPLCSLFVDEVVFMVQELAVTLHCGDLCQHRLLMAKYMLAMVHTFFMASTGGKLSNDEWLGLVDKGILTRSEASMLARYPGDCIAHILTGWVMLVAEDAMRRDSMWEGVKLGSQLVVNRDASVWQGDEKIGGRVLAGDTIIAAGPVGADGRVPIDQPVQGVVDISCFASWRPLQKQLVHTYNRVCHHTTSALMASHKMSFCQALPLPPVCFHFVTVVVLFNLLLLAGILSLVKSYATIPVFAAVLLGVMGTRSIGCAYADPFGSDNVDFPVPDFIELAFLRVQAVLIAFCPAVQSHVVSRIQSVQDFSEKPNSGLRHIFKHEILYQRGVNRCDNETRFAWSFRQKFEGSGNAVRILERSLVDTPERELDSRDNMSEVHVDVDDEAAGHVEAKLEETRAAGEALRQEVRDSCKELKVLRELIGDALFGTHTSSLTARSERELDVPE
eukprot:TRINITY_DN27043_c0_g2_i1.p1 TRINITY_DN27043_c0_g2~~TRINITY_DN27043_c0_g2_i1.p1  ORF type:complete len:536 (-),score=81.94 TRINITY_DN27043_c0_g2_i1:8-1615(-)